MPQEPPENRPKVSRCERCGEGVEGQCVARCGARVRVCLCPDVLARDGFCEACAGADGRDRGKHGGP